MDSDSPAALAERIAELRMEHRALDQAISSLQSTVDADDLQIRRLKKRKLQLRDHITRLESRLIPDLDA